MYFEVTVRTNWQFWKWWYFQASVHSSPMGISFDIMAAFLKWFLYFFVLFGDMFWGCAFVFLRLSAGLSCSCFPGRGAVLRCISLHKSLMSVFNPRIVWKPPSIHTCWSTVNRNRNCVHTHGYNWVIISEALVCCRANVFFFFFSFLWLLYSYFNFHLFLVLISLGVCSLS